MSLFDHPFTLLLSPIDWRIEHHHCTGPAKTTPYFRKRANVVAGVVQRRVENRQVETVCVKRQVVEFGFYQRERLWVMTGGQQPVTLVNENVESRGAVIP